MKPGNFRSWCAPGVSRGTRTGRPLDAPSWPAPAPLRAHYVNVGGVSIRVEAVVTDVRNDPDLWDAYTRKGR